jgi:hypothetical protein
MMRMSDDDRVAKIQATMPGRWDSDAIRAGAIICLTIAVPFVIIGAVWDGLGVVSFFGAVIGFIIGSGSAAWAQRCRTPLSHATVTAVGTFGVVQGVLIVVALLIDNDVNWASIVITLSFVLIASLIGGFLGSRLQTKGFAPSSRR